MKISQFLTELFEKRKRWRLYGPQCWFDAVKEHLQFFSQHSIAHWKDTITEHADSWNWQQLSGNTYHFRNCYFLSLQNHQHLTKYMTCIKPGTCKSFSDHKYRFNTAPW